MKISMFQVDAFTTELFGGNPAAVCMLPHWLPDEVLQSIAEENNLSETAFLVPEENEYQIRWFTPATEVDLCGHATLASGYVILEVLNPGRFSVVFQSRHHELTVSREGRGLLMDFPAVATEKCSVPEGLQEVLGVDIQHCFREADLFAIVSSEDEVLALQPEHFKLLPFSDRGVVVSAPGLKADFVSRAFFPAVGIPEDPVTGSTHCALAPYWAKQLGKTELTARQLSRRGGSLSVELKGERVRLIGEARMFLQGEIRLPG